jgi:hypothetical protein
MINCEQFEDNYLNWKNNNLEASQNDEMKIHFSSCQYCAEVTTETIEMRESIAGISEQGLSEDFEVNLNRRISELVYDNKSQKRFNRAKLPRWAALGAGMATGLAIGVMILMPSNQGSMKQLVGDIQVEELPLIMVVDTTTHDIDTSKSVNEPYRLDDRSKMVSGK